MEKAFLNSKFLESSEAKPIRLISELIEPLQRLNDKNIRHTIAFFGSARILAPEDLNSKLHKKKISDKEENFVNKASQYYSKARQLAQKITDWSLKIKDNNKTPHIITGGGPGIMEAANRGTMDAGGNPIGMTISIPKEDTINKFCDPNVSFNFHYIFMRKYWLFFLTKAFVVFPGGVGTLDELFEILTLIQTLKIKPVPIILFGKEYWESVINFNTMLEWGFIAKDDINLFKTIDDIEEAAEFLKNELTEDLGI